MKILGYEYRISRAGTADEIGACGRLHAKEQKIQVAVDLTAEGALSSVLHEVIEALNYHLELGLEHKIVMALEAGLYQVLSGNGVDLEPLLEGTC